MVTERQICERLFPALYATKTEEECPEVLSGCHAVKTLSSLHTHHGVLGRSNIGGRRPLPARMRRAQDVLRNAKQLHEIKKRLKRSLLIMAYIQRFFTRTQR
jgi:hypothetical protein